MSDSAAPDDVLATEQPRSDTHTFNRRRPLFWLALAFCAGIALDAAAAPRLATAGSLLLATLGGSLLIILSRRRVETEEPKQASRVFACALMLAVVAGLFTHATRARILPADDISRRTTAQPSFVTIRGCVLDAADTRSEKRRTWTIDVDALGETTQSLNPASGRVRVNCSLNESSATIAEGDTIACRVRLEAPPEHTLPDGFDVSAWLRGQGVYRVGEVFPASIEQQPARWWRVDLRLRRAGAQLSARLAELMAPWSIHNREPGSQAAMLNALLFGRRERLDVSDREAFAVNGTAHLLAISGLQIQFLAGIGFFGAAFLGLSRRRAALAVLILTCVYCALAGADAPVLRATLMISLYLAAVVLHREPDMLNVLGASALLNLALAPAELFSAGFQLSYVAVAALITLYPALDDAWRAWRAERLGPQSMTPLLTEPAPYAKYSEALRQLIFVSLIAWLATAPIVAWHMGRFSTLSLFVNLLTVPWSSVCMMLGIAVLIVSVFSASAASLAAFPAFAGIALLQIVNDVLARIPAAAIDLPAPAWPLLLVYAAVLGWIWLERGREATFRRVCILFPACLLLLLAGVFFREAPAAPSVTFLDLKRGRAALVESPAGGAALIDAGARGQGLQLSQLLRRRGITRLEMLVITSDSPEALDGATDLLKHVPAQRVILPRGTMARNERRELEKYLHTRGVPFGPPQMDKSLRGPGEVLWEFCDDGPPGGEAVRSETALCVRVSVPGTRVLFVEARSNAALQRLTQNAREKALEAEIVRVFPGDSGRWPEQLASLVRQSGCRAVIAGSSADPEEVLGLDLAQLSQAMQIRLLSPVRSGSLRIHADTGVAIHTLQAFRNGTWADVP
ncbi:MAG TPA: ComEC/Rec2 family competence protein [Planctomycetota bacterium]|nr:ComEC/Rec2 family competence protein [Planctomycetota bacterium]